MSASYITDSEGNVVYPKTLAKCVNKGGSTLEEYLNDVEDATLIKPTAQGTDIQLKDASDMNIQELHLYGKTSQKTTKGIQLLNLKDAKGGTGEGVTYTVNADGSVARKGTATGYIANVWLKGNYYENTENKEIFLILEAGKTYYIKDVVLLNGQVSVTSKNKVESNYLVTINEREYPEGFKVTGIRNPAQTSGKTYNDVIYPIVAESSIAIEWEEYTGGQPSPNLDYPQEINCIENPTINVAGKNLAITQNVRGSNNLVNAKIVRGQKYTLSFDCNKRVAININSKRQDGTTLININPLKIGRNSCSFIAIDDGDIFFNCYGSTDNTNNLQINNIQIERGDTSSDYEPYKEIQTATLNYELNGIDDVRDELIVRADGTGQLIQRLLEEELNENSNYVIWYANTNTYGFLMKESKWLFRTNKINIKSNKLKGITKEVGNPGTYDKNGIFVDTAGLYIKISKKYLTEYTVDALKTYLRDNPITVVGLLKEPIVNELSAKQVQEVIALHTNKPNTTIWNDQDAEMQITYVADAKNYIDNKFIELENSVCGGLLITDNLIDNSNMLNNTALTISDKISTSSNSTYKTYLNIPVKAGESYYIGKSHRNSCIIDSIENKKVLQSNMVNQTDSYIFNVNYNGFLCVCFYTTEQNPKIALLTREKTES
jgi:hypothetical protein